MWEALLIDVISNIVVPEVASFMKRQHDATGKWPTEEELRTLISTLADDIKREGNDFLKRNRNFISELPKEVTKTQVHVNKAENSDD